MPEKPLFKMAKNPMVRIWLDKDGEPHYIEIRSDNYWGYLSA